MLNFSDGPEVPMLVIHDRGIITTWVALDVTAPLRLAGVLALTGLAAAVASCHRMF